MGDEAEVIQILHLAILEPWAPLDMAWCGAKIPGMAFGEPRRVQPSNRYFVCTRCSAKAFGEQQRSEP